VEKKSSKTNRSTAIKATNKLSPLRLVITLLIQAPQLIKTIDNFDELSELEIAGKELLSELWLTIKDNVNMTTGALLEHYREHAAIETITKLANLDHLVPEDGMHHEFVGAIQRLKAQAREQQIERLMTKAGLQGLSEAERQQLQALVAIKL
jgi:DNA primase